MLKSKRQSLQIGTWSLIFGLLPIFLYLFEPGKTFGGGIMGIIMVFAILVSPIAAIITGVMAIKRKQSLGYAGFALGMIALAFIILFAWLMSQGR